MTEEPHMLVEVVEDNILVATFNRPDKLNAMSFDLMAILDDAVARFRDTPELRVMLIKSKGRYFSAGADLKQSGDAGQREYPTKGSQVRDQHRRGANRMRRVWDEMEHIEKPIVVAHHARCVGGSLEMSLSCDFRLAGERDERREVEDASEGRDLGDERSLRGFGERDAGGGAFGGGKPEGIFLLGGGGCGLSGLRRRGRGKAESEARHTGTDEKTDQNSENYFLHGVRGLAGAESTSAASWGKGICKASSSCPAATVAAFSASATAVSTVRRSRRAV